jgi:N-acetylglutamate synthase
MPSAAELDGLLAAAWPAPVVEELDGWRLRFGFGMTGRANSVWPRRNGVDMPVRDKIDAAEAFYVGCGLRPRFQLSPASEPAGLDDELAGRSYERIETTAIEVADTAAVAEASARLGAPAVQVTSQLDDEWLDVWLAVRGFDPSLRAHARSIVAGAPGAAYARIDGIAVGRAVADGDWVGITATATLPRARRKGAARAVLHALAVWALERGAPRSYLPVEEENVPARALYRDAGFEPLYTYHYRQAPA